MGDNIEIAIETEKPKAHNSKPITRIEVSPNEIYLVTYSQEDRSIVGWNVVDEGKLMPDHTVKLSDISKKEPLNLDQICVSDDKRLACIYNDRKFLKIINMNDNNNNREMRLFGSMINIIPFLIYIIMLPFNLMSTLVLLSDYDLIESYKLYGTFNLSGEFMLYKEHQGHRNFKIFESKFSHKVKLYRKDKWFKWFKCSNSWKYKINYKIVENVKFISASKYDKLYLFSNNYYIHEWNIHTKKSIMFKNELLKIEDIKMSSNEKFVCLRIMDKIIIYSVELESPIASLDINNDIQLYNFMDHTGLYPLLLPLFDYVPNEGFRYLIMEHCWKKCLDSLSEKNELPIEYQSKNLPTLPNNIHIATKCAFGILDGYVWKIKLEEKISKMGLPLENDDNVKGWNAYLCSDEKETYDHLNIQLYHSYANTIRKLFKETNSIKNKSSNELEKLIECLNKWNIEINYDNGKINLLSIQNGELIDTINGSILRVRLFNNNILIIITTIGLLIYTFNESKRTICLAYFYSIDYPHEKFGFDNFPNYVKIYYKPSEIIDHLIYEFRKLKSLYYCEKALSKSTLPLPNYYSFKLNDKWVSCVKDNKESLLKYGVELLSFAIKEHKLELMDDIYKKCMNYFKQDLGNNWMFLSIITSTMPLFNEYYPEYITRYSLDTTMITDSLFYSISQQKYYDSKSHLHSFFQHPKIVNSNSWLPKYGSDGTKSWILLFRNHPIIFYVIFVIDSAILSMYIIVAVIMNVLLVMGNKLCNLDDILNYESFNVVILPLFGYTFNLIFSELPKNITAPTIIFMNPYIKFDNYPKDYNWVLELIWPRSSPFVKTINRDIYKTWNGEALINYKWSTYGIYYYGIIWFIFMAFLGCFTAAATIPQEHLNEDNKKGLFISSATLGFIHLSFEVRQFLYNPRKWTRNCWNYFDLGAYLVPTITSVICLRSNNVEIFWLSFSCLLLDLKFLLFLRAFESFGVYFAIIVGVAKRIIYFLVILLFIIISFAHAFLIILRPRLDYSLDQPTINNDPNNPWNLNTTYNQVENETATQNASFVQVPDGNTNMFTDYKTALFAMYLFLTGDTSALTNKWEYKENPALVLYIILFSFLIVIYLMNLFIGLLNLAIEKENSRVSYLVQKAEILAEIELFYMLPCTRRREDWFPTHAIYYYADSIKTRKKIKELISEGEWKVNDFKEMKKNLLESLSIDEYETHESVD